MPFVEDLDQFVDEADFGEPMEWNGIVFNAIFDNETYRVEGGVTVPVDIQQPRITTKTSNTAGMTLGDPILRVQPNIPYTIETIAPDGTGMSVLGLAAAGHLQDRIDTLQRDAEERQRQRQG